MTVRSNSQGLEVDGLPRRSFVGFVALFVLFAALLIVLSAPLIPLTADEYEQAHEIVKTIELRPYVDFLPRTNILSHLLLSGLFDPPSSNRSDAVAAKLLLGLTWVGVLVLATVLLRRSASTWAIVLGLGLLCTHSTFLQRCSELRAEGLAAAFTTVLILGFWTRRFGLAGAGASLAILASQLAVPFVALALAALVLTSLGEERAITRVILVRFSTGFLLPIFVYLSLLWTSAPRALGTLFRMPPLRSLDLIYPGNRTFPLEELAKNGFFWITATVAGVFLLAARRTGASSSRSSTGLAFATMVLGSWLSLRRPSLLLFAIPAAFVLLVRGIDAARDSRSNLGRRFAAPAVLAYVLLGLYVPLSNLPRISRSGLALFQAYMTDLAERLLMPGDSYFAGVNLLFGRQQANAEILAATQADGGLGITALDEFTADKLIRALGAAPPKVVMISTMLDRAPERLQSFVEANYARYRGCVFLYGPMVTSDRFTINFPGRYVFRVKSGEVVEIDGVEAHSNREIVLSAGEHRSRSTAKYRLRFVPDEKRLMARFGTPTFLEMLPDVYDRTPEPEFNREKLLAAGQQEAAPGSAFSP